MCEMAIEPCRGSANAPAWLRHVLPRCRGYLLDALAAAVVVALILAN